MSKLPRDIDGRSLVKYLKNFNYQIVRQTGSHMRLIRETDKGTHHLTIPSHSPLKIGTLNAILDDVAAHLGIDKRDLINSLFD
jgi:predicted RNA binding protein YcfA (HicA-like mRNA interferase family)